MGNLEKKGSERSVALQMQALVPFLALFFPQELVIKLRDAIFACWQQGVNTPPSPEVQAMLSSIPKEFRERVEGLISLPGDTERSDKVGRRDSRGNKGRMTTRKRR